MLVVGIARTFAGEDQRTDSPDDNGNEDLNSQDLKEQSEFVPADKKIYSHNDQDSGDKDKRRRCF